MKRKAAALNSRNPNERVESHSANSKSKKKRVSEDRPQIGEGENQKAIKVYNGGGEPVADRKKRKSRRQRKSIKKICKGPNPLPGIPDGLKDMIQNHGGANWRLIIQKGLQKSDVSRFSMPSSQWITDQAFPSELLLMLENNKSHVSVQLIDTNMRMWDSTSIRMCKISRSPRTVVIAGSWNDVVKANNLKYKDIVQIWCFKFVETGRFGLAMVKIEGGNCINISSSDSQIPLSSNVAVPGIEPLAQPADSASSSNHSDPNQYPSIAHSDSLNTEFHGAMNHSTGRGDHLEHVVTDQVAGCESSGSRVMTLNNGKDRPEGSVTEAALLPVTEFSSDGIDLSLHL